MPGLQTAITVALDWTPSVNHVGFYVAKSQGLYAAQGLDVSFASPHTDDYKVTPGQKVERGEATFGICPSETVISYHVRPPANPKPRLQAVAALLQEDTSAIVTLKSSGIDRPAKLEGKRYASYGARFEGRIVQQLIKNDGGSGDYQELALPMLGLWNTVLRGEAEATWVFMGWEGVEAQLKGLELNAFKLSDYGVAYGYSPVLVAHPDTLRDQPAAVKAFLEATAQGYQYAVAHPEEAADLLTDLASQECPGLPEPLERGMVREAVKTVAPHLLDSAGRWGAMEAGRWGAFLDWLSASGLLTTKVQSRQETGEAFASLDGLRSGDAGEAVPREAVSEAALFTNDFLPQA